MRNLHLQYQHYYTLENPIPLRALGLNAFSHPWIYKVNYIFSPPALVPLVLFIFPTEHVTGQSRLFILVSPCWVEAPWLLMVLNMLEDIPHLCPVIKDLIIEDLVGQVLKGLPLLYLTLWLLRSEMCVAW